MAKKQQNWDYLDDDAGNNIDIEVKDCNGNLLVVGDSVIATKDIKVKGATDIKRGAIFKSIRLTEDAELIESGKMVLRTEFFKKK